ncbi:hypothetical protein Pla86_16120 [Planctomycetes bacterium Pla86]|uniref:C3H1-type domain-containing protein n=2 Tax=Engelhardtia mirabilis TaxID=2528011 RepID=A0A518BHS5_9BACT|nr:hypothetical protein Pla133_16130 [Planctomycetes bacterium Pla133]QDV00863.1 hypothetical protein Pla86_16120 [Planctomycetes bacterium Pla86]
MLSDRVPFLPSLGALACLVSPAAIALSDNPCPGCEISITDNAPIASFGAGSQAMNYISMVDHGDCFLQVLEGCKDGSPCTFFHQWSFASGTCGDAQAGWGYRYWDIDDPGQSHGATDSGTGQTTGSNSIWIACNSEYESAMVVTNACDPPQTCFARSAAKCSDCVGSSK